VKAAMKLLYVVISWGLGAALLYCGLQGIHVHVGIFSCYCFMGVAVTLITAAGAMLTT
jgi:hypothetical protein